MKDGHNTPEQTSPNLTSPNQRTAPMEYLCKLEIGSCPLQSAVNPGVNGRGRRVHCRRPLHLCLYHAASPPGDSELMFSE